MILIARDINCYYENYKNYNWKKTGIINLNLVNYLISFALNKNSVLSFYYHSTST